MRKIAEDGKVEMLSVRWHYLVIVIVWVRIISFLGLVVIDRHACQLAGARCCTSQGTRRGCKIEAMGRGDQCRRNEKLLLHDPSAGVIVELSPGSQSVVGGAPQVKN